MRYLLFFGLVVLIPLLAYAAFMQMSFSDEEVAQWTPAIHPDRTGGARASTMFTRNRNLSSRTSRLVSSKSIFHPERRGTEATGEEVENVEETVQSEAPSDIKVTGIVRIGADRRLAYMTNTKEDASSIGTYEEQDVIGEYEIIEILADRVKLQQDNKVSVVKLSSAVDRRAAARRSSRTVGGRSSSRNEQRAVGPTGASRFSRSPGRNAGQNVDDAREEQAAAARQERMQQREKMRNTAAADRAGNPDFPDDRFDDGSDSGNDAAERRTSVSGASRSSMSYGRSGSVSGRR
ncbi:hypothetical protein JW905_17440 [bacterium]|nr:hypothetical protein [candidate division CSSED10-310 bacterium]